jgi:acetylornithine deacetylase/succinyl-diaminopimelate desuccinylase-like protein
MAVDWQAAHSEALDILVQYLQVPSVNPPGDEEPAARFLGGLIEREGIPVEYIQTAPNRACVIARLRGDGSQGALMLCNHLDVVPVEERHWSVPPFAGVVRDGFVYGRGAVDMKGIAVLQLMAFLLLARERAPLKRDLIFCAVPDEEAGGKYGMRWLCEHRPDVVDVAFALNEGALGATRLFDRRVRLFPVATAEKTAAWMRLRVTGRPGHGSRPHRDNAALHLVRALNRLADWQRPIVVTPPAREYLRQLIAAGVLPPETTDEMLPALLEEHPAVLAMFTNTLNITMLRAGTKVNVIPAEAEAAIDCRLLPGVDPEAWRQEVLRVIDDPRIEVTLVDEESAQPAPESPWETELCATIRAVITEAMEDAIVLPTMTVGGTDNRFLRQRGVPAYGFAPMLLTPEEAAGFHGNDERLSIANLEMGCELFYEVVRRFCT